MFYRVLSLLLVKLSGEVFKRLVRDSFKCCLFIFSGCMRAHFPEQYDLSAIRNAVAMKCNNVYRKLVSTMSMNP